MGNAYDNYDELVHTLSGLDSLHDTMGIFYQNVNMDAEDIDEVPQPVLPTEQRRRSRKRKLDVTPVEIAPYRKKPRMDKFEYPTIDHQPLAELSHQALKLDTLFMVGHSMDTKTVPMWGGFNARVHQDKLPKQVVHYLPNINRPINRDDVVAETMRLSMKCAEECEQRYGLVTYDLDVAKTAHKIQVTNRPEFDNLFVMFGVFHILMCLFRAI